MSAWEYRLMATVADTSKGVVDRLRIEKELDKLGHDGWEVCGFSAQGLGGNEWQLVYTLKRPKQDASV